ncbi:MAG: tetratricopeptide repeat protein [Saprospiraceae bacterium]
METHRQIGNIGIRFFNKKLLNNLCALLCLCVFQKKILAITLGIGCAIIGFGQDQQLIDSLLQITKSNVNDIQKAEIYNELAYQYHTTDTLLAIKYAQRAIDLARSTDHTTELGTGYKNIARTYGYYGNNQQAILHYDTAYQYFTEVKDTQAIIGGFNNVGRHLSNVGQHEKAIQGYQQAEKWLSLESDSLLWLIVKYNHAYCLYAAAQYQPTVNLCAESLPIARQLDSWYLQSELHSLTGLSYTSLLDFNQAEQAFSNAFFSIPRAEIPTIGARYISSVPDLESNILNNRALLYIEQGSYQKALDDLLLAVEILENVDAKHPNGEFYVNLGIVTQKLERWQESEAYFKEGLRRLEIANQTPFIGETYGYLAEMYRESGKGILAHDYLKLSHEIQDSILSESTQKHLQELNVKYETAKFREELAATQLQVETQQNRLILITLSAVGLLLLAILSYYFYNAKQQRRLLALEKKQIELQYGLLRAQMNPHFIFNALNSIHGFFANNELIRGNEFMGKFSRLVRQILDQSVLESHSLSDELDTLRLYLDIEKERMDGNMDYSIYIAPEVEEDIIELPPLLFQPFVENAIWHGIAPKEEKGHIWIDLQMHSEEKLHCQIKDDGVGLLQKDQQMTQLHTSKGIRITRERLGDQGEITIHNNANASGVSAEIIILIT